MKRWILFCSLFFTQCNSSSDKSNATTGEMGLVEYVTMMYDTVWTEHAKPVWTMPVKIWFKDSLAIEEQNSLNFVTDTNNVTTTRVDVKQYRFNSLRDRTIYVYKNFSDTAKIITKYSFDDTTVKVIGGWGFNHKREHDFIGEPERLQDTIINGVEYKRLKLSRQLNGYAYDSFLYFRCDRAKSIFTLDTRLTRQIGCPCVKFVTGTPNNPNMWLVLEINLLRGELNLHEVNVFNAWMRNSLENPVK